ncbi:HAD family hydrolase [Actinomadura parmotrematis]|uniref:HAD family hydrolase n=1 Tax=Actinomadura parmotrematis TaxID=2864039 RepID=A0ABS7FW95_9ACTN|nr:HAD family hydrolase [Actinomadura parmotrematis]MBW8484700.1 HAD family hydrolase [Actinomadura parmotrematis]
MTRGLVLFDLDGTLFDHRASMLAGVGRLIADAAVPAPDPDALVLLWRELEERHMREFLDGACSFAEQRRRRLRGFLPALGEPVPADDAGLDAWFAGRYRPHYEAAWRAFPDARPCLDALRALPAPPRVAVLTNGDAAQQEAKLARIGLRDRFEAVLTPADLGTAKPDPAAFTAACRLLGAAPDSAVSVGDWWEGDAVAARRAGLTGIWLDRGPDVTSEWPADPGDVPRIDLLTDLPAHLLPVGSET